MENFDNYNDQFVLSHELIELMQWIIQYNPEGLKKVIEIAISRAENSKLKSNKKDFSDMCDSQELQNDVIDFFSLMEICLYEIHNKQNEEKILQKHIIPAMDHVDTSMYDPALLKSCATTAAQSAKNPKEVFLKELLKRWKPNKKVMERN